MTDHKLAYTEVSLHGDPNGLRLYIIFVLLRDRSELVLSACGQQLAFPDVHLYHVFDGNLLSLRCRHILEKLARSVYVVFDSKEGARDQMAKQRKRCMQD